MTEEHGIASVSRRYFSGLSMSRLFSGLCDECGDVSFWTNQKTRYCSLKCRGQATSGPKSAHWKGGRRHIWSGHIEVRAPKDHPNINARKTVLEHRLVMEGMIGRYLRKDENVHHKNGIRDDNRPENLELWSRTQPAGQRVHDKLMWMAKHYGVELRALFEVEDIAKKLGDAQDTIR